MNIVKKLLIGALLLAGIGAQNMHAMQLNDSGEKQEKLSKEEIRRRCAEYFGRNQINQNQAAQVQPIVQEQQPAEERILIVIEDSDSDQDKDLDKKDLKRKRDSEEDNQPNDQLPAKKQKLDDVQSMDVEKNVNVFTLSKEDQSLLSADQLKFFNGNTDPFSATIFIPDCQILIFMYAFEGDTMPALMTGLSKLATVCKSWHGIIFNNAENLVFILNEIWRRGNCQSMNLLHYCAKRGFARASKMCLYNLVEKMVSPKDPDQKSAKTIALNDACSMPNNTVECIAKTSWSTPLHYAAQNGNFTIFYFLAEMCFDVDVLNGKLQTPLLCTAQGGHYVIVLYLESKKANPNVVDADGKTLLHYAVLSKNQDIINFALQKCKKLEVQDKNRETPFDYAIKNGDLETCLCLYDGYSKKLSFNSFSSFIKQLFEFALKNKQFVIAQTLSTLYTAQHDMPLFQSYEFKTLKKNAIKNGLLESLKYLYENIDIAALSEPLEEASSLYYAIEEKKIEIVRFFLEKFKSHEDFKKLITDKHLYDGRNQTLIYWAIINSTEEIITLLLDEGAIATREDLKYKYRTFSDALEKRLYDMTSYCIIS